MLTMTAGVNNRVAEDTKFAGHVYNSLVSFAKNDWGTVDSEDKETNDIGLQNILNGNGGMVLAAYGEGEDKIWIIMNEVSQTVLFPNEY
jgi:hypothetical protein